jgi:hypothetical protein
MFSNTRRNNTLLLIFGAIIVIASIFPWVTVSFVNARGIDGWRGFVSIATGIVIGVFAASQLWSGFIDSKIHPYLRLAAILMTLFSIGLFVEIGYKTLNAAKQIGDLGNSVDSSLGDFGDSLNQFANSLAEQFNPQLAIGWYMGLIGLVASLVLLLLKTNTGFDQPLEKKTEVSEVIVSEKTDRSIGKVIVYISIAFLVIAIMIGLLVKSNMSDSNRDTSVKPYVASLEVRSASKFISTNVNRQVDKWNGFGYAKYTEWANRFITMTSSFQTIAESEVQLSYVLGKEFYNRNYSNENYIMEIFKQFESDNVSLQAAINSALECSSSFPSNNECDPQFRLVSSRLGTLKGTSDKLASFLD